MIAVFALAFSAGGSFAGAQDAAATKKGPERWENDIRKFETAAEASPPPKDAILFVGSSSIRMWKLEKNFPGRATINRGFGGSTLADSIHFFDRLVTPCQPKAIVLYAGDNDMAGGLSAEEVASDFETFAELVREELPGVPLIYIAIKPSIKRWKLWPAMREANRRIASFCAWNDDFYFADISVPMLEGVATGQPPAAAWFLKDGLHLTQAGYDGWTKVLEPILQKALAVQSGR